MAVLDIKDNPHAKDAICALDTTVITRLNHKQRKQAIGSSCGHRKYLHVHCTHYTTFKISKLTTPTTTNVIFAQE